MKIIPRMDVLGGLGETNQQRTLPLDAGNIFRRSRMASKYELGRKYSVIDGPSKFDLMVSLFVGSNAAGSQSEVYFTLEDGFRVPVRINGIEREDGSGESWCITGYFGQVRASGYFSTSRRHGYIEFSS
jgi:hypothetical protein